MSLKIEKKPLFIQQIPRNTFGTSIMNFSIQIQDSKVIEIYQIGFELMREKISSIDSFWLECDGFKIGSTTHLKRGQLLFKFNRPIHATNKLDISLIQKTNAIIHKNIPQTLRLAFIKIPRGKFSYELIGQNDLEQNTIIIPEKIAPSSIKCINNPQKNYQSKNQSIAKLKTKIQESGEFLSLTVNGNQNLVNLMDNTALYYNEEQISAETIIRGKSIEFRIDNGVTGGFSLFPRKNYNFEIISDLNHTNKKLFLFLTKNENCVIISEESNSSLPILILSLKGQSLHIKNKIIEIIKLSWVYTKVNINTILTILGIVITLVIFLLS